MEGQSGGAADVFIDFQGPIGKTDFVCARCHRDRFGRCVKGMCRSCYCTSWLQANPGAREWRWAYYSTEGAKRRKRDWALRKRYGITLEDYEAMLAEQESRCVACGTEHQEHGKFTERLVVDHDHTTGRVRGLLCNECNKTLGRIESGRAPALLRYLEEARKRGVGA